MNSAKKVIIIGGGASGIAAATRLFECGIQNVVVLEAENRIGGRIQTIPLRGDDGVIELGAQWVHGEDKNVIFEMMTGRDLFHSAGIQFNNFEFIRSTSEILNKKITNELFENFRLLWRNVNKNDLNKNDLKEFNNLGEYIITKLREMFGKYDAEIISCDIQNEFIEWCHQFIKHYEGSDSWFQSSILFLSDYWQCEGDHNIAWKKHGFQKLFSVLMEKAQKMSNGQFVEKNILFNKEVEKVQVNNNYIRVECKDGSHYTADHVIVTVSLGVLKEKYEDLFCNVIIPDCKVDAIKKLGMGTVNKIFLKFPYQWIPEDINGISILWKEEDKNKYREQRLEWLTDIFVFNRVDNAPNVICGWISGKSAREIELLMEDEICIQITQFLQALLNHKYKVPDAEYCRRSTWSSNPHFRGSYSFLTPETDDLPYITFLAAPLTNKNNYPVILFAGEATQEHYYSTVHGAVESGWREANRILSLAELKNTSTN